MTHYFLIDRRFRFRLLTIALLSCVLAASQTSRLAATGPGTPQMEIVDFSVGFDGKYKIGAWTPVRLTIHNAPSDVESTLVLTTSDDEGIPCQFENTVAEVIRSTPSAERTFEGYVCFGRRPTNLQANITIGGETAASSWRPTSEDFIASTQQWVLMIGAGAIEDVRQKSLGNAARLLDRPRGQEVRVSRLSDPEQLPQQWFGFYGFDLVVVCGKQPHVWSKIRDDQWHALDVWTRLGGQLMLSVGDESETLLSSSSPAKRFVPGEFAERIVVPATTKLEEFANATDRLDVILQSGRWPSDWQTSSGQVGLPMALLREPQGLVVAAESFGGETIPLISRDLYGLGHTLFVAFDIDSKPLRQWSGYNKLMLRLLGLTVDQRSGEEVESVGGRVSHLGFSDISGQLRTALEQFPGVILVPFAVIGLFAACYVLLIGPAEYYWLSQLQDKMHWTWLIFPTIVMGICALSMLLVNQWKGSQPRVNQVDLIDWDAVSGSVRGLNWSHFYSPNPVAFDCELRFHSPVRNLADNAGTLLAWDGLPGRSFGGMDASSPFQPYSDPYTICLGKARNPVSAPDAVSAAAALGASEAVREPLPQSNIRDLNVLVASSRAIRAEWWNVSPPSVQSDLQQQSDSYLAGMIENPFEVELRDCSLLYDRWYYKLGTVEPSSQVRIGRETEPRSLKSHLIGRTVQEDSHTIAPWQQTSFDVPRIMEMMMFQRAAGGRNYTGLLHRHHRSLDFTDQLAGGRAVLVGRIQDPATSLNTTDFPLNGTQNWTYVRVLLPVSAYSSDDASSR